jgi:peptide/nickel transport system permease protein
MQARGLQSQQTSSADMVAYYKHEFGLDGSLWEQYYRYFNQVIFHLNFGPSVLSYPKPAMSLVERGIPWTLALIGSSVILSWLLGMAIGTLVGWKRNSRVSSFITNFCLLFQQINAYFIALVLVIFISYRWNLLPPAGAFDNSLEPSWSLKFFGSAIHYGILPVMAQVITGTAGWVIGTRALIVTLLGEDFLTYANAKGLSTQRILFRYVLRNAWLPQIAALGISLGFVVNGNILIEQLFRYPGVGNLLINSVNVKDVNTAMAIVSVLIFFVLTINLIIDLILPIFDPRVKYAK